MKRNYDIDEFHEIIHDRQRSKQILSTIIEYVIEYVIESWVYSSIDELYSFLRNISMMSKINHIIRNS